jgi:hypothetical protein
MIFVKIFAVFCYLGSSKSVILSQNKTSEEFLVSKSIAEICEEIFVKKSIKFDLIIYGERTRHLSDIADGVLGLIDG